MLLLTRPTEGQGHRHQEGRTKKDRSREVHKGCPQGRRRDAKGQCQQAPQDRASTSRRVGSLARPRKDQVRPCHKDHCARSTQGNQEGSTQEGRRQKSPDTKEEGDAQEGYTEEGISDSLLLPVFLSISSVISHDVCMAAASAHVLLS
jgi:hypothetical protein